MQCTSVSLVDDDIVEDTEQFSVEVSSTSDIVLIASPSSAVYSIADDDGKFPTDFQYIGSSISMTPNLQSSMHHWKYQVTQLMRTLER